MIRVAWIAVGGAIGAVLRYAVSGVALRIGGGAFPWGTLTVNVLGSFIAGFFWAILAQTVGRQRFNDLFFIGLMGAFTTFSTYSLESIRMAQGGQSGLAVVNVLANNVGALLAVVLGFIMARWVAGGTHA